MNLIASAPTHSINIIGEIFFSENENNRYYYHDVIVNDITYNGNIYVLKISTRFISALHISDSAVKSFIQIFTRNKNIESIFS